jgi:replicative DNA helicase
MRSFLECVKINLRDKSIPLEERNRNLLKTGINAIDDFVRIQKKQLITIAARPSMGKTALAINLIANMAPRLKNFIAFFTLESSISNIYDRIWAKTFGESLKFIKDGFYVDIKNSESNSIKTLNMLNDVVRSGLYEKLKMYESPKCKNVDSLCLEVRRLKRNEGVDVVVIDHLHKMNTTQFHTSQEREITEISNKLQSLAIELDITVIVLAQLNRAVETRDNKKPSLNDLRGSGAIEQDSDAVIMLYRPGYYNDGPNSNEGHKENGYEDLFFLIRKNRDGETGESLAKINLSLMTIKNLEKKKELPF